MYIVENKIKVKVAPANYKRLSQLVFVVFFCVILVKKPKITYCCYFSITSSD